MNVATNLEWSAYLFPQHPALCEGAVETSYALLNEKANKVATGLIGIGIKPGDHVALCAPNSTDWLAFYFGVLKAGAVAVTLSSLLSPDEMALLLSHAKPRMIYAAPDKLALLQKLRGEGGLEKLICPGGDLKLQHLMDTGSGIFKAIDRDRTDTAAVLYTGGTTGIPKGVMLTHENINTSAHNVAFSERSNEKDRAICYLPFNHVFGQMHIMNATVLSSGCLELLPSFDMDRVLEILAAGRVTKLYSVPTGFVRFLGVPDLQKKLGAVRYCFSAAAVMAAEVVRQWREKSGLTIYEGYGLTESASAVTYNHYHRHVIGSIGTAVPGVEVQIRDEKGKSVEQGKDGEISIRGHNIMKGYLDNPGATQAAFWRDGWFRSGDIGHVDENGYVYIVDRLKDMIITGGENVYPREVEEVLYERPEVRECAVIGLPDNVWGERVSAYLILKPGKNINEDELRTFLKSRLAPFKVPKEFNVVTEFPLSPTGKILKRELKRRVLEDSHGSKKAGT
jgi:long-chain acyl-CoA synthetase